MLCASASLRDYFHAKTQRRKVYWLNMQNFFLNQQVFSAQSQENLSYSNHIFFAISNDAVDIFIDIENMCHLTAIDIAFRRCNAEYLCE